ncbi:MAG TPA: isoprenyl transferase [Dictyoglomaceae bacterium]|nr:isoprenyl transferase [Dictyoglomaceae bacterium]HOL39796.1 isoprenyl transferase [Dictyoglomaceae bacterium]HOP95323.1 isoprenyl transferase [Dictyoglomaceae bacterium]HPP16211.1 isoprenyl transferase [Dictyoglomaceae bacterium]HPU42937.1 isoprenyl transferase [Dictyoglomaceae bacterium]
MIEIPKEKLPKHIAFIMDGNGRWAKERNLPRIMGHKEGSLVVEKISEVAFNWGIQYLTFFAFSTENWKRPREEVEGLMQILDESIDKFKDKLIENHIKLKIIGDITALPPYLQRRIKYALEETKHGENHILTVAINYGGRWDIVEAAKKIIEDVKKEKISLNSIDTKSFSKYLSTSDLPDPDFLIRTSGEYRISNFMLWQLAYTEIWFTPKYWPDFNEEDLKAACIEYSKRKRRFGGLEDNA